MPIRDFPVVLDLLIPAGMLGPELVTADVHCFLIPHESGVLLVDTGPPGSEAALTAGLAHIGAGWSGVTDVVLTHAHFDHTAGLPRSSLSPPQPACRQAPKISRSWMPADVLSWPWRTAITFASSPSSPPPPHPEHLLLLDETASLLLVGALDGTFSRAPAAFTADGAAADEGLRRVATLNVNRVLFSTAGS
jgi:glyoxylase-like metal-dependent hydrolase (beta-lactamase superfamily II)